MLPLLAALTVLAALFSVPPAALAGDALRLDERLTVTLPAGYTALTADNLSENGELVSRLGYSVASFRDYMEDNGVLLVALGEGGAELRLSSVETEFSRDTTDLRGLDGDALRDVAGRLTGGEGETVSVGGWTYFRDTAPGDGYFCAQYITLCGGRLYTLGCYADTASLAESAAEAAVAGLTFEVSEPRRAPVALTVILWVLLGVAVAVAALVAVNLVRGMRRRKRSGETQEKR